MMVFSVYLVWGLQMDAKLKSIIVTTFALRLFVTPITIIRLVSVHDVQTGDLSFTYVLPETMTQLRCTAICSRQHCHACGFS